MISIEIPSVILAMIANNIGVRDDPQLTAFLKLQGENPTRLVSNKGEDYMNLIVAVRSVDNKLLTCLQEGLCGVLELPQVQKTEHDYLRYSNVSKRVYDCVKAVVDFCSRLNDGDMMSITMKEDSIKVICISV